MELKVVEHKTFTKTYLTFLLLCCLAIGGSYLLASRGFRLFPGSAWVTDLKSILLYVMIGIAVFVSVYQRKQQQKLRSFDTFEEKIVFFERFFRTTLWWHVLSCATSGFLLVLTGRKIFFYFGLFDLLMMLLSYPAKAILRRLLNEDELIFH